MFKILIPAVASLALIAFTAKTQDRAVEAVAPTPTPVMAWHLSQEGDIAKLAYGIAESDQLALMVTCAPGDRTAMVYGEVRPVSPNLVAISEEGDDGGVGEMQMPLHDAALRHLAVDGEMLVTGQAGTFGLTATRQERRAIGQFLGYCSASRAVV